MAKFSENKIPNINADWGLDESNGLPYSGQAVQDFLKDSLKDAHIYINQIDGILEQLSRFEKYGSYDIDKSRYLMVLSKGYSGHKLLEYFREKKIQSEMSFSQGVVLILSPFNTE